MNELKRFYKYPTPPAVEEGELLREISNIFIFVGRSILTNHTLLVNCRAFLKYVCLLASFCREICSILHLASLSNS